MRESFTRTFPQFSSRIVSGVVPERQSQQNYLSSSCGCFDDDVVVVVEDRVSCAHPANSAVGADGDGDY